MGKITNIIFIAAIVVLLIMNINYRNGYASATANDIAQTATIDSLTNANMVYDTLLTNMLMDTSKINLHLTIKMDNPSNIKKERKGIFNWRK